MLNSNNKLLKLVSSQYDSDLSNTSLIACQHILGTTVDLFKTLIRKGLKPSKIFVIGKCYSTNNSVMKKLKNMGINIDENSSSYNSRVPFDEQLKKYVDSFIKNSIKSIDSRCNKIIILDDGGQVIESFNEIYSHDFTKVAGVEQTSSGYQKLSKINLFFPVLNIARSKTKLEIESPIIANIVVKNIKVFFKKHKIRNPKILLVGSGHVGSGIVKLLSNSYCVESYDIVTHGDKFPGKFAERLHHFDAIIGTTGQSIIEPNEYEMLKRGAVLISASSSDREFSFGEIRKNLPHNSSCHADMTYNSITVANSGFPINFTGRRHSAPPNKIILTRALLLAGVLEASANKYDNGIVELPHAIQNLITKNFKP